MRWIHYSLLALAVLAGATELAAQAPDFRVVLKVLNSEAVGGLPDAGYYILTANNVVYHYTLAGAGLTFSRRFALDTPGDGADITFVRDGGHDSVVVTQWADKVHLGFVRRYDPAGKVLATWQIRHVVTGVDFDQQKNRIYFVTLDSNELYSVDLSGGEPHVVCEARGALQLGPLAVDANRQLAYTSDAEGRLFVVDLTSKKVTQLSPSFGLASALRFDSQTRILYVADQGKQKIYAVDLSTAGGRIIGESSQIANPSGLAPGPGNTLLVTDLKSGNVYLGKVGSAQVNRSQQTRASQKK